MTQNVENLTLFKPQALPKPQSDPWELHQLGAIARRRLVVFIAVSGVIIAGVICKQWLQKPIYKQQFQLMLDSATSDSDSNPLADSPRRSAVVPLQFRDFKTEIEVLASYKVISPLLPTIQSRYPDIDYRQLVKQLKIKHKENTAIVEVSYQDTDPEKIEFVLDKLAEGYTAYYLEKLQTSSKQALKLVEALSPQQRQRVDQLQVQLQRFRRQNNLVDPEKQSQVLTERLSNIIQQRQETQALLGETQSTIKDLQQQLGIDFKQAVALSVLGEDPNYLALLEKLQRVDAKIASESVKLSDEHPSLIALREERQHLLSLIQQQVINLLGIQLFKEIQQLPGVASPSKIRTEIIEKLIAASNQFQALLARQKALAIAENQARRNLQQFAGIARQYADLSRDLEIANQSLNRFLVAKENLQIETARKVPPWQVISRIEAPNKPISPNPVRDLLLGGFAGLLAGIGTAIAVEKFDNKYHSPEEIQDNTGLTLLGTIPFQKELKAATNQLTHYGNYTLSHYWEAYISLQTNLDFLDPDKPLKSLVISSALPGEGKSTIAVYLAQVAASMGKRVLLIDADLRRPTIHTRVHSLTNVWGLSNLISGSFPIENIIQISPENENLHILTAGKTPPNPAQLLSSSKMRDLLVQFQKSYDLVIVDTPPLHGFADAKFLASQTNGLIMVIGLDKTEKTAAKQVLNDLQISHIPLLGMVANGIKGYQQNYTEYYNHYYSQGTKDKFLPLKASR